MRSDKTYAKFDGLPFVLATLLRDVHNLPLSACSFASVEGSKESRTYSIERREGPTTIINHLPSLAPPHITGRVKRRQEDDNGAEAGDNALDGRTIPPNLMDRPLLRSSLPLLGRRI